MPRTWALQDAKNRFSEVVDTATTDGAQTVTRRGQPVAVVLSIAEYRRLLNGASGDFVDFLLSAPRGDDIDISRDPAPPRPVDLE